MNSTTDDFARGLDGDSAFHTASVVCGSVLLMVFLCSLVLSCTVLWALRTTKLLQNSVYRMIGFILFGEVMIRIFGSPLVITSMLAGRWLFSDVGCIFYGFFMTWLGVTTTSLFSCVAIERYIIMCRPDLSHRLTTRVTNVMGLACNIHGFIWAMPPLLMINGYVYEPSRLSCTPDWSRDNACFIFGLFIVCVLIPVAVSLYCYIKIYRTVRRHTVTVGVNSSMDRSVACTTAITLGAFLFAWAPYTCIGLSKTLGFAYRIHISKEITLIPLVTAKSAGLWHPLIFGFNNRDIRTAIASKLSELRRLIFRRRHTEQAIPASPQNGRHLSNAKSRLDKQLNEVTHKTCAYRPVESVLVDTLKRSAISLNQIADTCV